MPPVIRKHRLIDIEYPEFGGGTPPVPAALEEFEARIQAALEAVKRAGLTHLVVYGDREHYANLMYLTNYDPRFEEALLILSDKREPLMLAGNEGMGYLPVSPQVRAGKFRTERYQPLSLISQPRNDTRTLDEIFADEGIGAGSKVGCAGWKYFEDRTGQINPHLLEIPAYMVDALRKLAGHENVVNATAMFMHPETGLRAIVSPAEIAYFEYTNVLASEGMKRIFHGIRDGIIDHELMAMARFNGIPLGCHPLMVSGANGYASLSSPVGAALKTGDPFVSNICYYGSNICRAAWIARTADDLPENARDYVSAFAGRYFEVVCAWLTYLQPGVMGDEPYRFIHENLPDEQFGIFLNPGHLIHLDEWVSSPFFAGSAMKVRSGMAMQIDIIPSSPVYKVANMEDGLIIADADLQQKLMVAYPDCYARCIRRREFMRKVLHIDVPDSVLPLSNIPSIVPPYLLSPNTVLALEA
jgi:hypothetical protein